MKKRKSLRLSIICAALAVVVLATAVILAVDLSEDKPSGTLAEASVVRASLSSNMSSTGVVKETGFSTAIPLAALVLENAETLEEIEKNDYTVNLVKLLGDGSQGPILYRVIEVNEKMVGKTVKLDTKDESVEIIKLAPVYFDWQSAKTQYEQAVASGSTAAKDVQEYVLSLLMREGFSDIDPNEFPSEFWVEDADTVVTVDSKRIGDMILAQLKHVDSIEFSLSKMSWRECDKLMLDNNLLTVSYSELYVSFSLSEYDVSGINARLLAGERVYASVGINALSGRTLVADIIKIQTGSTVSGISYFTLLGRLVFPQQIRVADGTVRDSYEYYDEFLGDETVAYLGVDLKDHLVRDDVLDNYSVTVSAQKTVVEDTLIVPTNCIYYDDAKRPYVVVLDAEKKEKRVYIKITLSTGVDAAVTAADGYTLNEGDVLRYIADAGLIGSLF
ncbi:MAG: hypothetical protein J6U87_06705 [Clostridia bacterium]|nr:hypothetical protein [Clostridia bacterium]